MSYINGEREPESVAETHLPHLARLPKTPSFRKLRWCKSSASTPQPSGRSSYQTLQAIEISICTCPIETSFSSIPSPVFELALLSSMVTLENPVLHFWQSTKHDTCPTRTSTDLKWRTKEGNEFLEASHLLSIAIRLTALRTDWWPLRLSRGNRDCLPLP